MKQVPLYIDEGYRPKLVISSDYKEVMRDAGVTFPREKSHVKSKASLAVPAHTTHQGMRAAVWLPNPSVERSELPIIAIATAIDRHDLELRKIEGFYIGTILTSEYVAIPEESRADELLGLAEFPITDNTHLSLDKSGNVKSNRLSEPTFSSVIDRFLQFMGIKKSHLFSYKHALNR